MNTTTARCGHPVPAVGDPGSRARRAAERRTCDSPRCRSGLPPKFTDEECKQYLHLVDLGVGFLVDNVDKSVLLADGRKFASLRPALEAVR
jgi:hypothetical protein